MRALGRLEPQMHVIQRSGQISLLLGIAFHLLYHAYIIDLLSLDFSRVVPLPESLDLCQPCLIIIVAWT
jgi:hypothetical protein